jgi:aldose sugar dehydrogenase
MRKNFLPLGRRLQELPLLPGILGISLLFATLPAAAQPPGRAASQHGRARPAKIATIVAEEVVQGLDHPWAMAFLPDGRALVTERGGALRIVDTAEGELSAPLEGTPAVYAKGQGGLLDVALDPDFATNRLVYLSFAEPGEGGASTAVGRGRLEGGRLEGFEVIFSQEPKVEGDKHFGGRIVFSPEGLLFLTLGERGLSEPAQDLSNHLGKVVRIERDGSVPADNPFADRSDARPEIWSYGHRNIEGAAIEPGTDMLWVAEMGPYSGDDELNIAEPGLDYGWGQDSDGRDVPKPPPDERIGDAIEHWTPAISPSGMIFYTGTVFPEWRGSVLIGGLTARGIVRLVLDGREVVEEERIPLGERIRDIVQGPDGLIYVLTDEAAGSIWRLEPQRGDVPAVDPSLSTLRAYCVIEEPKLTSRVR